MTTPPPDPAADPATQAIVRQLLEAAGMHLTDDQVAGYCRIYPTLRAQADRLWAVPELRYEQPALRFSPIVSAPDPERS